jgi:hypothetical protein
MAQPVLEHRLQVAELRAAIVAPPRQAHREHPFVREQRGDRVGELDLAARARRHLGEQVENLGRQNIAADYAEVGGSVGRLGLFHDAVDLRRVAPHFVHGHDAVALRLTARHLLDAEKRGAGRAEDFRHATHRRRVGVDQIVGEQHRERLVADDRLRAEHRVAQAERLGLADVHAAHALGQHRAHHVEQRVLVLALELGLDLVGLVEVVFDRALVAPGDEYHVGDPGRRRFFHRVLDKRLVDNRQHLLRARLGDREESAAEAGNREYGFSELGRHGVTDSAAFR